MTRDFGPWIIHEGNECPVEPYELVQVFCWGEMLDDAAVSMAMPARGYNWGYDDGHKVRIFAYRVADAHKRVKVRGHIYSCSDGTLIVGDVGYPINRANFTLSVKIDENGNPIPGTVRQEDV